MAQNKTKLLKNLFKRNKSNISINDIETNKQYNLDDLKKKIDEVTNFLKKKNIKKNDLIVVDLPNSIDFIAIYFACFFYKISIVPLSKALSVQQKNYISLAKHSYKNVDRYWPLLKTHQEYSITFKI